MRFADSFALAWQALAANPRRTLLIAFATAIGVCAVVLFGALGEGGRRYVIGQFQGLGANLLIVLPGRSETIGGPPPLLGATPRDLTVADAYALSQVRAIRLVAPVMVGNAPVSTAAGREREVTVLGATAEMAIVRHLEVAQGRFLPPLDVTRGHALCVLGHTLRQELFGDAPAYGRWVRVGDRRFRVIGVLAASGVSVGVDFDDLIIIPVASAQALFNREALFRVLIELRAGADLERAVAAVHAIIRARHEGEDDVTVITQDSVIATLGRILGALTAGVAGISAISLVVAGILIMNVMLVAVTQRRAEIGLMKALGATAADVHRLFLLEALLLAVLGGSIGLAGGYAGVALIVELYPLLPASVPPWAASASLGVAVVTGLVFGVLPARRAAAQDPVSALARR